MYVDGRKKKRGARREKLTKEDYRKRKMKREGKQRQKK